MNLIEGTRVNELLEAALVRGGKAEERRIASIFLVVSTVARITGILSRAGIPSIISQPIAGDLGYTMSLLLDPQSQKELPNYVLLFAQDLEDSRKGK